MKEDKKEAMLTKPIGKLLWKFGIPSLVGMLANALHNTIDAYFLGTVGVEAVAAVGIVFPVLMIGSAIGLTFGSGVASIVSRDLGGNRRESASRTLSTSFVVSILVGAVVAVLIGAFSRPIIDALGSDDFVAETARRYLLIVLPGAIFGIGTMVLNNATRAEGAPIFGMMVIIGGAILNSVLDAILIGVFSLDVTGAAVATFIAQSLTFAVLFGRYLLRRSTVQISVRKVFATEHRTRKVITIGMPAFIFQILTIASVAILNALAGIAGAGHVAGVTVANRVITLAVFVQFGFAKGIQPVIGFNWGVGRVRRARFAVRIMTFQSIFLPLGAVSVSLIIYYLAIGRTKETAILAMLRQGLLMIPLAIIMNALAGTNGLSLAPGTADAVFSLFGILMLVRSGIVQAIKPELAPQRA